MTISTRKKLALAGSAAGIIAAGIAVPAVAFAQDPSPSPTNSTAASDSNTDSRDQRRADHQDKLAEALAAELGVSKDKVLAALEKVNAKMRTDAQAEKKDALKSRLADAVSQGKLTQEEADAILKAVDAGVLPGGSRGMGGHGHGPGDAGPGDAGPGDAGPGDADK